VLKVALLALALAAPPRWRGVALGLYSEDDGFSYAPLLDEIAALGANTVELVINFYQRDARATLLYAHTRYTASDAAIMRAARQAHERRLAVVLLPVVRGAAPRWPDGWRGGLRPAAPAAWWRSYDRMIDHYARLAARAGATALVIGSELSTLDGLADVSRWRKLAAQARRAFRGS